MRDQAFGFWSQPLLLIAVLKTSAAAPRRGRGWRRHASSDAAFAGAVPHVRDSARREMTSALGFRCDGHETAPRAANLRTARSAVDRRGVLCGIILVLSGAPASRSAFSGWPIGFGVDRP
jgi:hypothetical protein